MSKRPTPSKRLSKDRGGNRYASYLRKQWKRLRGQMQSPFATFAPPKQKRKDDVTTIKA